MSYDFAFDKKSVFLILGGSVAIGTLLFFAGFVVGWDRGTYQARLDFEKQNATSRPVLAKSSTSSDEEAVPVALKSNAASDAGDSAEAPPATNSEPEKTTSAPEQQMADSSASEPEKQSAKPDPAPPAPQEKSPAQKSTPSSAAALDADQDDPSGFSLQIGAFQNEDNALRCVTSFKTRGYPVFVFHTLDARGRQWHTVRIGHYPSVDKASAAAAVFKGKEKMPVFVRPVNEL